MLDSGVDHIGHRFHANHEFMAAKLRQMDEMIDGILEALHNRYFAYVFDFGVSQTFHLHFFSSLRAQDRVLVMVFGDHGMTADGNHGGATRDETESALFIYSTVPLQTNIVADDFSSPQHVASSLFSASKSQQLFERDLNRYSSTKNADASDWFSNEISRAFSEVTSDTHDAHSIHIPRHSENDRSQFRLIDQV
jgi:predicted AlkP superfamily pyrophosphatase or phosphodiesterase